MMETLMPPYTPHLKKVLLKYQLSAVKSLQGPSNLLGPCVEVATRIPKTEPTGVATARESSTLARTVRSPAGSFLPPPFPVQQFPIFAEADQRSERGETVLEGEPISCFVVGGEKRLCLPQVLNSVLQNFTLAQINQVCDELQIFCSRCNPEQLEVLKVTGILPASAPSCGLITKTDAERLCSALLHHGVPAASLPNPNPGAFAFQVYHECFGKCRGLCRPSLYTSSRARCIECLQCHAMFTPQHFVCHAHRPLQNRTCHWGFDSSNWRSYLLVARGQPDYDAAVRLLNYLKETNVTGVSGNKRKNHPSNKSSPGAVLVTCQEFQGEVSPKRPKMEKSSPSLAEPKPTEDLTRSQFGDKTPDVDPRLKAQDVKESAVQSLNEDSPRLVRVRSVDNSSVRRLNIRALNEREVKILDDSYSAYLQYTVSAEPYIYWYDTWRTSAFRPWPSLTIKEPKSPTNLKDSVQQTVPAYLSQGPPVLLNPEKVVPLSESERFDGTFQPNVALAPATHRPKIEYSDKQVKCELTPSEEGGKNAIIFCHPSSTPERKGVLTMVTTSKYNPEIEVSTDTDDSLSEATGGQFLRAERVVEQVAEVLDALSDAKETIRARVVALVQQLALRLNVEEAKVRRLQLENLELRHLQREQVDLVASKDQRIAQLQQRLEEAESSNKEVEGLPENVQQESTRTSQAEMMGTSELTITSGGSPVSVIRTSPPSVVIKSEPSE